jgi:hypothetical protein
MADLFYPPVTSIMNFRDLPEELNFVWNGIEDLLEDILLKEYQVSSNHNTTAVAYYVVLTSYKKIGIDIPGTGLALILNPSFDKSDPNASSDIPISLNVDWPILKVVHDFDIKNFHLNHLTFLN